MNKQMMVLVGERVRRLREGKGWSQKVLGQKANVGQKTVSNIERAGGDRDSYTLESLASVCDALGVPIWQMLLPDDNHIARLVVNYKKASENGRHHIDHIAELEARYASNQ